MVMLFCTISLIVLQITFVCDVDVLCYQSLKQESVVVKSYTKKKKRTKLGFMMTKPFTYFGNDLRISMMHIFFQ